jgi:hypothetical protein
VTSSLRAAIVETEFTNLFKYIADIDYIFACLSLSYPFLTLLIGLSSSLNGERTRVLGFLIHRPGCWSGAVVLLPYRIVRHLESHASFITGGEFSTHPAIFSLNVQITFKAAAQVCSTGRATIAS